MYFDLLIVLSVHEMPVSMYVQLYKYTQPDITFCLGQCCYNLQRFSFPKLSAQCAELRRWPTSTRTEELVLSLGASCFCF